MRRLLLVLFVALAAAPGAAQAADPPPGSTWTEEYFPDANGTMLHADVLRPASLPKDAKTPVIMTVSPYTNHAGSTPPVPPYDPQASGPSDRFYDFVNGAHVFTRGYTYVMVDLPGFGGSAGCNDWGGPSEQGGVKGAVEWAASQPWSNGKVGLYGKSYDGWTGLMGLVQQPKGLAAVVSMEPVYEGYRYLYMNGVRFDTSVADPAIFTADDASPGTTNDTPQYLVNGTAPNAACYVLNIAQQQQDDDSIEFWKQRALVAKAKGVTVPLFLTQGFLEDNTKPDAAYSFFNAVAGPKRAWFGMWDHVRGNEVDGGGHLMMGRPGFFDEVMRFYDHYLKGVPLVDAPTDRDPPVALQSSDGKWRSEQAWPPADARTLNVPLKTGSYTDDGNNNGTSTDAGIGIWTFSPPLTTRAIMAGEPALTVDVSTTVPNANLVADVYDVDSKGSAILISRGALLLRSGGRNAFTLYGDDWILEPGHRIGVLLTSSNADWWTHIPTQQTVTVNSATIALPFLTYERPSDLAGSSSVKLNAYRTGAPFPVDASTIAGATLATFPLPGPLLSRPTPAAVPVPNRSAGRRLVAHIGTIGQGRHRRIVVYGTAPSGSRVAARLVRGKRTAAHATRVARLGSFRFSFSGRRSGRYRALVSARAGSRTLRTRTAFKRVR